MEGGRWIRDEEIKEMKATVPESLVPYHVLITTADGECSLSIVPLGTCILLHLEYILTRIKVERQSIDRRAIIQRGLRSSSSESRLRELGQRSSLERYGDNPRIAHRKIYEWAENFSCKSPVSRRKCLC